MARKSPAGWPKPAGRCSASTAPRRRRVPVLRLHPVQDDAAGAGLLAEARRVDGVAGRAEVEPGLHAGGRPHPRRGHRQLGRPGRGRAPGGDRRVVRGAGRTARRPRSGWTAAGARRRSTIPTAPARSCDRHRHRAGDAADRRPCRPARSPAEAGQRRSGRTARRCKATTAPRVDGRARRRRDRLRAGPGVRALRQLP